MNIYVLLQVKVWRVESSKLVQVDKEDYGMFYSGDCYVILYTYGTKSSQKYIIYFWQGQSSTRDEVIYYVTCTSSYTYMVIYLLTFIEDNVRITINYSFSSP